MNNWKLLTLPFKAGLKDALEQQHHAVQYIAMVGRHLIPRRADDSNTNMEFDPDTGMLVGNPLSNGMKVGLHLDSLDLAILDQSGNEIKTLPLNGKTKNQGFIDLKEANGMTDIYISYVGACGSCDSSDGTLTSMQRILNGQLETNNIRVYSV